MHSTLTIIEHPLLNTATIRYRGAGSSRVFFQEVLPIYQAMSKAKEYKALGVKIENF